MKRYTGSELYSQIAEAIENFRCEKLASDKESENAHVFSDSFEIKMCSLFENRKTKTHEQAEYGFVENEKKKRFFSLRSAAAFALVLIFIISVSTYTATSKEYSMNLTYSIDSSGYDPLGYESTLVYCLIDGNTFEEQFTYSPFTEKLRIKIKHQYELTELPKGFKESPINLDTLKYYDNYDNGGKESISFTYQPVTTGYVINCRVSPDDCKHITYDGKDMVYSYTPNFLGLGMEHYSLTWVDKYQLLQITTIGLTKDDLFKLYNSVRINY